VYDIEPKLINSRDILGGTYTPGDSSGDIHKFCMHLSKVMIAKYSVKFNYDCEVRDLRLVLDKVDVESTCGKTNNTESFDTVVICAGVDSPKFSRMIGESLNIYPVKGYSITVHLDPDGVLLAPEVSLLDEETKIVASRLSDSEFRVAGTAELAGLNYDIRYDRIKPLINWVKENFPGINTEYTNPWAGLRPMTPNMLPIVRPSRKSPRILLNTGHGHLGWTLAPATAMAITNLVVGKT
jgi:D-amino-acid dehydrogenase